MIIFVVAFYIFFIALFFVLVDAFSARFALCRIFCAGQVFSFFSLSVRLAVYQLNWIFFIHFIFIFLHFSQYQKSRFTFTLYVAFLFALRRYTHTARHMDSFIHVHFLRACVCVRV